MLPVVSTSTVVMDIETVRRPDDTPHNHALIGTTMQDERHSDRVIYVGTGRQPTPGVRGFFGRREPEDEWRQRLTAEMDDICREMARRGYRLVQVVPALSSIALQGSWTEGLWLIFSPTSPESHAIAA